MGISVSGGGRVGEVVAMNVIDRLFTVLDGGVPWTVHAEWAVARRLEPQRLSVAAEATLREHPLLRARWMPAEDAWLISDPTPRPSIDVTHSSGNALTDLRGDLVSRPFDLQHEAPVRFHLIRTPSADHVVAVADHALVDGVGIGRVVATLMAHLHGGERRSVDQRWRAAHTMSTAPPIAERVEATLRSLRSRLDPRPVRLARDRQQDVVGYGVSYLDLPVAAVDALTTVSTSGSTSRSTAGDVAVAAVCLAGIEWNRAHGAPALPFSVGVPLNLRPARSWLEGVCNATFPWPVRVDDDEPREILRQVSDQLRPVRAGLYSKEVRGVLAFLATRTALPLWMRLCLTTTTMVSTVPGSPAVWASGDGDDVGARIYGGYPAAPNMSMTFAVIPDDRRWRLSARYMLSHHSSSSTSRFLRSIESAVRRLCDASQDEAGVTVP
jgi:hypothetical protein